MSSGGKFLSVVDTYGGYCQICNEARFVGRIAVAGWPFHGSVCARCLGEMADELHRRATALGAGISGNATVPTTAHGGGSPRTAAGVGTQGDAFPVAAGGNGNRR